MLLELPPLPADIVDVDSEPYITTIPNKTQAYSEWKDETLAAFQTSIQELLRVISLNSDTNVLAIAALRALVDKEIISMSDIADNVEAAQHAGVAILGISITTDADALEEELSAEDRFALEEVTQWDGTPTSRGDN